MILTLINFLIFKLKALKAATLDCLFDPTISDEINQIEIISLGSNYGLFRYEEFQQLMRMYPLLDHWRNRFQLRPDFVPEYR